MQESMIDFINQYGYFGIAFMICLETIFPPIPSEVVLIFSGYLITQTAMRLPWAILTATIGSVAGAAVLYLLGYYLGKSRLDHLLNGVWGKRLHFNQTDLAKTEQWFSRYQGSAVFLCRFVPIVRSLISIPAGITRMQPLLFFSLTLLGSLGWNTILILLGQSAGSAWQNGLTYIGWYSKIILAAAAVAVICLACRYYYKKRR
ncbi:MAG: DedA family protein [Negativicutes bacterium]|nr:DedA family protein [Negativicutes bacterium]